ELKVEGFSVSPAFNQMLRNYSVEVPYENASVKILVKPESSTATAGTWEERNGVRTWTAFRKQGEYYVYDTPPLKVGENKISAIVQAETGKANPYELTITRLPSTDASLKPKADGGLMLKKVERDPVTGEVRQSIDLEISDFDPNKTEYTVTVSNEFNEAWF